MYFMGVYSFFMVHKKFGPTKSKKTDNWYDRAPPINPRNYLDEMAPINGKILDNEQENNLRERFRDEVSKRMGDLLLKGHTMLDAYCQTCSGIIMEDRSGVQRCVTCEIYNEHVPQQTTNNMESLPIDTEDLEAAPMSVQKPTTSQVVNVPRDWSSYVDYDDNEEKTEEEPRKPVKSIPEKVFKKKTKASPTVATVAKSSISSKIEWAAGKLNDENNTQKILEYLEILKISAEALKAFDNL